MEVYIIFSIILFIFSFFEIFKIAKGKLQNLFLFVSFLGAVLIIGGRWYTGTDWLLYEYLFHESDTLGNALDIWKTEIGYGILSWLVRAITDSYSTFLFVHAIIFYGLLIISFKKIVPYPQTAFLFYFISSLGIVGSNRQLLGVVCILFGVSFLLNENKKKFIFLLIASISFHATAYLGGSYFFLNRYFSKKIIVSGLLLAFIIGVSPIPLKVFGSLGAINEHFMSKTEAYLSGAKAVASEYGLTIMGVFKRLFFFLLFFVVREKTISRFKNYNLLFNGYWVGILIYLFFSSSLNVMVSRGSLYFNIMECLLMSSIFIILKKPLDKMFFLIILYVLGIVLMYQSIGEYPDLFDPYKGIWYNTDFFRKMH
ncbi:EpsG family protein [Chryseobacterium bernardetii]|uniref:EpsG family protein n=1 Tax=Chryseobacterium bernardetii TaxID=1241978 RepID=A0A3G6THT3_9FLAO|nr:EpsG family protein [Chryseobacterium bernardetii]AZB27493.1 EpsG family protein [Chryseobacterium bernardetii]